MDGWSQAGTGHDVLDLAKRFEGYGVEAIIYTDIGRDGMMSGVNIPATVELARELTVPVIASGGPLPIWTMCVRYARFRARVLPARLPGAPSMKEHWNLPRPKLWQTNLRGPGR